jgi:hypothetical protein
VGAEPRIWEVAARPGENCVGQGRMSTGAMPKESSGRIELLQGTLDMLILRTLLLAPRMGIRSPSISNEPPTTCSRSSTDRSIPRCTGSNAGAGSPPSGRLPRKT